MQQARPSLFIRGYDSALYLLSFSIPLLYNMQSAAIGLLGLCWLLSGQYKAVFRNLRTNGYAGWWLLYFALLAVSLLYSQNLAKGGDEIGRKLSFLLLPLFIAGGTGISRRKLSFIYTAFVLGMTCSALICIGHAALSYPEKGTAGFYYDNLPYLTDNNAVFASWKCFLALAIVLFPLTGEHTLLHRRWAQGALFFLLFVFFILLSSKTLILFGVTSILLICAWRLFTRKGHVLTNLLPIVLVGVVTLVLFNLEGSPLGKRYRDVASVLEPRTNELKDIAGADNYSKRMTLWTAAWQNYKEQGSWIGGSGIGDVQDLQDRKLADTGFHYDRFYNFTSLQQFNIHNMYLQTLLGTGMLGLLTLAGLLLSGLWYMFRNRHYLPFVFFLVSILFLAQESALQIQAGIVYLSFFTCVWASCYRMPFFVFTSRRRTTLQ